MVPNGCAHSPRAIDSRVRDEEFSSLEVDGPCDVWGAEPPGNEGTPETLPDLH